MENSYNCSSQNEAPTLVQDNLTDASASVNSNFLFSSKNHKRNYTFIVYENYVQFIPPVDNYSKKKVLHSPRGDITTFSPRSRFRLFALLGKLKKIDDCHAIFITLTYHYGYRGEDRKAQADFHTFLTRARILDPDIQYIWRIEYQKRGAPHFHLIVIPGELCKNLSHEIYTNHLNIIWHTIADPQSQAHSKYGFKVVKITDYMKACAYLSKYIAKIDGTDSTHVNIKHWGNSRKLPIIEYEKHDCMRERAALIIEEVRKWLLRNGKDKYASPEYFNVDLPQGIFINIAEFNTLLLNISGLSCAFKSGPDGFY